MRAECEGWVSEGISSLDGRIAGRTPEWELGTGMMMVGGVGREQDVMLDTLDSCAVPFAMHLPRPSDALAILSLLVLASPTLSAQTEVLTPEELAERQAASEAAPLFATHEPLVLTLRTRIDWLRDERPDDEEADGVVIYLGDDGTPVEVPVEVRTRGNFRREKRNCNFPPLRLDFPRKRVSGTVFAGQNRLKLVTPCHDGRDQYQEYVLREYLVYRTLNILTPLSFRVRLVEITYEDVDGEYDTRTKTAFLIEDEDQMAYRNGSVMSEWEQFHPASLDDEHAVFVAHFQFMIGNTDWSGPFFHNTKMVRAADGRYLLVPYDFDFSGSVDARYAAPAPELPIRDVEDRLYRGFCRPTVDAQSVARRFLEARDSIEALHRGFALLEDGTRERLLRFYGEFFEVMEDPRRYERQITRVCRDLPA